MFRMHHCLQFRLRAMVEREALSVFLEDYAFSPLRCPIVIARSFCYVDLPCTHAWGGGGLLQRHCVVDACVWASNLVGVNVRGGVSERTVSTRFLA